MIAFLAILAATLLAYCLFLLKVTREDGREIRNLKARVIVQQLEITSHRRTFRDIEHAIELAAQTIADYDADPLGWDATEATVQQFRAELDALDGGAS